MLLQFDTCFKRINTFLKLIGMSIDTDDTNKTALEHLRKYWFYYVHMLIFTLCIPGQMIWLIQGLLFGATLWEITYLLPCLTLCLLGFLKACYFVTYMHYVSDLYKALRNLQSNLAENYEEISEDINKWLKFLSSISKLVLNLIITGVVAFALGPFLIIGSYYLNTGKLKLVLPFLLWYPFDEFDIRVWPFVYLHQLWSAWVAVNSVYGPDCFFYACCTFIQIQFRTVQYDIERIVKNDERVHTIDTFKAELVPIVNKHRELIRCVNLLENIYSKSTLFNVATSSFIICAAGFNLMAIDSVALMAPFFSFLIFGLLQIFVYCYYGDYLMTSSMGVGDAIYNSLWYETGAAERKYLLIVLIRSQNPCRLTAYGFTDINLRTFTRILSSSWSYFALLKQMYHR